MIVIIWRLFVTFIAIIAEFYVEGWDPLKEENKHFVKLEELKHK